MGMRGSTWYVVHYREHDKHWHSMIDKSVAMNVPDQISEQRLPDYMQAMLPVYDQEPKACTYQRHRKITLYYLMGSLHRKDPWCFDHALDCPRDDIPLLGGDTLNKMGVISHDETHVLYGLLMDHGWEYEILDRHLVGQENV